jgi:hypothetical protein
MKIMMVMMLPTCFCSDALGMRRITVLQLSGLLGSAPLET